MRWTLLVLICSSAFGQMELKFIQNKGQWNERIDFQAQVPGGKIGVSATGFSVLLMDEETAERNHILSHKGISEADANLLSEPVNYHYFQINFIGANQNARAFTINQQEGYYNYFLGNDPCGWATNAFAFGTIVYSEIYPGIDLRVSSLGKNLKYDFIVKVGADPSQIKIEYCGVDDLEKLNGELKIKTVLGSLAELKPYSFQDIGVNKQTVANEYRLIDKTVSFSFPNGYDECRELTIDPVLIFSTYSGSTADNWGSTATPGEHGTLYSAGVTHQFLGGDFPATIGAFQTFNRGSFDMAIIKYDSTGSKFLYATHLGGSNNDSPESLVVDKSSGDLIVLGISSSPDYPTGISSFDRSFNFGSTIFNRVLDTFDQWDIVLTRLAPTGDKLVGSTFLGGSDNDGLNFPKQSGGMLVANYGDEMRGDVITDSDGNVFVSSVTSSADFPIINGFDNSFNGGITDGVIVKLTPDLSSIVWSSYVGGSGFDAAYSIRFDPNKNVILGGGTSSVNFPVTLGSYQTVFNGTVDGWLARISTDGSSILNATYTGTLAFDQVYFIDLNRAGEIYCFGQTTGNMVVSTGVYNNANSGQFLQKFSDNLSSLIFSTVFGSGRTGTQILPNISPTAFLVNECDNIYMSGWGGFVNSSNSTGFWQSSTKNMPVTNDAFQKTTSGSDFYFMVLNGDATELRYATYLGGSSSATHVDGGTSRFDKFGIVYHAVCSGCQFGNTTHGPTSDFPTTPTAWSRLNKSKNCNNAAFKFDLASLRARLQTNTVNFSKPGFNNVCYPDSIRFQNLSTGGETFIWDFGDGTTKTVTDTTSLIHKFNEEGQYEVKLKAIDLNTCAAVDSTFKIINYFKQKTKVSPDSSICVGNSIQLFASGGAQYSWESDDGKFKSSSASPLIKPDSSSTYFVTITDSHGCVRKDTVNVDVIQGVKLKWKYDFITDCQHRPFIAVHNQTSTKDDVKFKFDFGDGTTTVLPEDTHEYDRDSLFTVSLIAQKEFCEFTGSEVLPIYTLFAPNVFTPDSSPGFNDRYRIGFGSTGKTPADVGLTIGLTIVDRWGKKVFESSDYKNDWSAQNLDGGVYYTQLRIGQLATCKNWLHIVK